MLSRAFHRALSVALLLCSTVAAPAAAAEAGNYPNRPVRFIAPFPPGASDVVARIAAQKLSELTGQQFIIDNRSGAGSTMGAAIAAKAPADGYTILFITASFAISAAYYNNLPYDARKDFAAAGLLAYGPLLLVTHPAVPVNSVKDIVAMAKAKPGQLNYASAGPGSVTHLAGEMFNQMAGVRLTHVPYRGAAPALTDVLANQVQLLFAPLGVLLPHVKAGRLKAIAVPSLQRSALAPELPTVAESGVPGYAATTWYAVVAPRDIRQPVLDALNRHIRAALASPDTQRQLTVLGIEPASSTPKQFGDYLQSEITKYARLVKEAGLNAP